MVSRLMLFHVIVHGDNAYYIGQRLLPDNLRKVIPRQLFEVAIQAAIGAKIIARESMFAIAKRCYCKMLWW